MSSLVVGLKYAQTTAHQALARQDNEPLVMSVGFPLTQTAFSPSIAICFGIYRKTLARNMILYNSFTSDLMMFALNKSNSNWGSVLQAM